MDKVRAFMRVVWLQRFWLLSVVGVIVAVVCWSMAAGKLDKEFAAHKSTIDGKFSDMSAITAKSVHGNDEVNARETREASQIRDNVLKLWEQIFSRQSESVLKWPDVLGEEFLTNIEKKQFGDKSINSDMRNTYWNYIKNRFDALVKIPNAQKLAESDVGGGYGGRGGGGYGGRGEGGGRGGYGAAAPGVEDPTADPDYLVQWHDQGMLRAKLEFQAQPTPTQIWVTQEDLWVYETLLNIIAQTNKVKGATRPYNTAIHDIVNLEVGRDAALASAAPGQILMPAAGADAVGAEAGAEALGREGAYPGGEAGAEGADPDAELLTMRYIGDDGKPSATAPDPATPGEFRKLPIRMVLYMDQKWITTTLVECANAPLPVEVQRLRINPEKSGIGFENAMAALSAAASPGMGGGEGGGRGGYGRGGYGGGGYGGGYAGGGQAFQAPTMAGPDMAQVEIQGVVYIYNPPNKATLNVPGGEAAPEDVAAATQ